MSRLKLLDMYCCAGGAAVGYDRAGFEVVGVDVRPQPNYPHEFVQWDVFEIPESYMQKFDAFHASPPCQAFSDLAKRNGNAADWSDLIADTRALLQSRG